MWVELGDFEGAEFKGYQLDILTNNEIQIKNDFMKSILRLLKRNFLWVLFFILIVAAITTREDDYIFISQSQFGMGKYVLWILFIGFLGYSLHVSSKENFFKSVKSINQFLWGRQIGIDLYIGLLLPLLIISLHGGTIVFFLWLIPVLIYANLATLLYFALNYDSLVSYFMG